MAVHRGEEEQGEMMSKTSHDMEPPRHFAATKRAAPGERDWSAEASQELLRLRFRESRGLFDDAQTVADVHEAWSVVASKMNASGKWGPRVDAIECSDHLMKLRQQWQESSTAQLHLMMAECFGKSAEVPPSASNNINRAMEEALAQASASTRAHGPCKRSRTIGQTDVVSPPRDLVSPAQAETLTSHEGANVDETEWCIGPSPTLPESAPVSAHNILSAGLHGGRLVSDPALTSPHSVFETLQEFALPVILDEEEEFPRQDEIVRAIESRSQQLEKLSHAHRGLASVTHQLMEALNSRRSAVSG
uniref:Myb-like domain-containing protein n=1 Tax=Peronospora matthiolae TaxID=2874970 RepID=A0AAV1TNJ9_9STRA